VHGRGSPAGTKKDREQVEREIKRMEGLMGKGLPVPFLPRDERLAYIAKLKG
jgi:hypothetical protein